MPERQYRRDSTIAVDDEGTAIEDELVLSTDLIDVGERKVCLGHPLTGKLEPLMKLVRFVRGPVRDEQEFGSACGKVGTDGGEPDVFADGHAQANPFERHGFGQGPRFEHALLVEHAV